jgi:soluble lytic murein transglycosylase-like protein
MTISAATLITVLSQASVMVSHDTAQLIVDESARYKIDPLLTSAIIYRESRFTTNHCYRGAYGLMQVQTKSKQCLASHIWQQQKPNITEGLRLAAYWRQWCKRNKHTHHWLLHYNQGFGRCSKKRCFHREKLVIETGHVGGYARRVLAVYRWFRSIHNRLINKDRISVIGGGNEQDGAVSLYRDLYLSKTESKEGLFHTCRISCCWLWHVSVVF